MVLDKQPVVCIVGPTAVGKSDVSLELAEAFRGEVISADSMQVYRHMDIGTAKLPVNERRGIAHHMIDVVSPLETFTVHNYAVMARVALNDIVARGHLPIVVGGTGLYIRALVDHFDFTQTERNDALREELSQQARSYGTSVLYERLLQLDPDAASRIHHNDERRLIRALEVVLTTGKPMAMNYRIDESPYLPVIIGLTMERTRLYARIEQRVEHMIEAGLEQEVRTLFSMGCTSSHTSMQAIGYKEFAGVIHGELSLEQATAEIKQATRRYAKRQLSWFRADPRIRWYETPEDGMMNKNFLPQIRQTINRVLP